MNTLGIFGFSLMGASLPMVIVVLSKKSDDIRNNKAPFILMALGTIIASIALVFKSV